MVAAPVPVGTSPGARNACSQIRTLAPLPQPHPPGCCSAFVRILHSRMNDFFPISFTVEQALGWLKKGGFAVLDQGLFAGTNFLVNILLARWLSPEEYGAFAVTYSIFLLLGAFHTAVLTEPMLVFGAGKYSNKFREYLGILLYGHWGISLVLALFLGLAALAFWKLGENGLARPLAGLTVATPFLLLLWLARRGVYVHLRSQWAFVGSALYFLLGVLSVFLLLRSGWLSSATALVALGMTSLVASVLLFGVLRPDMRSVCGNPTPAMIGADHWTYGRWLLLHTLVYWIFSDAIFPAMALWWDFAKVGVFRAYQNLLLPLFQFLSSLSPLFLSWASARFHEGNERAVRRMAFWVGIFSIGVSMVYALILLVWRTTIVALVLGQDYLPYQQVLTVWVFAPIILAFRTGIEIELRARQEVSLIFYSYLAGTLVAVIGYLLLIPVWELYGAVWSRILGFAVYVLALSYLHMQRVKKLREN